MTERRHTTIRPVPPYDFALTAAYHTYFQTRSGADVFEDGVYRRLLEFDGRPALISVRSTGSITAPELSLELAGDGLTDAHRQQAAAQAAWMLGTGQELAPFYQQAANDPPLAGLSREFPGLHLPRTATLFEALALAILGQQIAASVARTLRRRLIETYGIAAQFGGETYYAFPRPAAIAAAPPEELRALKLSARKAEYLQNLAAAALNMPGDAAARGPGLGDAAESGGDTDIPGDAEWGGDAAIPGGMAPDGLESLAQLPEAEFTARLTALRGIGHWTAQWALVRGLARPDALPLGDLALRRAVSRLYRDHAPTTDADVAETAQRWRPYRTYATVYLFAALRRGMV